MMKSLPMNAMTEAAEIFFAQNSSSMTIIATVAPLAGRLAFAAVFGLLILWLIWIPTARLQSAEEREGGVSVTAIRLAAIAIAALQVLLYLLWR